MTPSGPTILSVGREAGAVGAGGAGRWITTGATFGAGLEAGATGVKGVHGVTLQAAYFDRLFVVSQHDAGAFAKHVHRADARTAQAENVRV